MRTWFVLVGALAAATAAACSDDSSGPSRKTACAHVCSCFTYSTASGMQECETECGSTVQSGSTDVTLASNEQCYACATEATCGQIIGGTACQDECATSR